MRIILGIDPGSVKTGFGLIACQGSQHTYISSGVIRLPVGPLPARLKVIFDCISFVFFNYFSTYI